VDVKKPARHGTRAAHTTLLITIAATACWSSAALARTQPDPDCGVDASPETLADPVESLILKRVDHVPVEQEVSELEAINLERATGDTGTPLLNLAPRFNDTLREVFGKEASQEDESEATDVATSPVAEYEDVKNLSELTEEATPIDSTTEEDHLPLLRRQMYRIDI
jgi:hypothetical protein